MKGVEIPPKFDPKNQLSQVALLELRIIILNEIEKLMAKLFFSQGFLSLYRDYTGEDDYRTFQQKLLQIIEEERTRETGQKDETGSSYMFRVMSEIVSENESSFAELCQVNVQDEMEVFSSQIRVLSPDYSPPTEWKDIVTHLSYVFVVWQFFTKNPDAFNQSFRDSVLLLSFSKLMGASYELLARYTMKGERELSRTKESTKSHQKRMEIDSKQIKDAFYDLQFPKEIFPNGVSLHKVAGMVHNVLKAKIKEPPGIDKIKGILRNDETIWKQFKETKVNGRKYFIKQI
jgi:hypothetical protein